MILLGINSSGIFHFGNYISLIKPILNYNKKRFFLADLHSISKKTSTKYIIKNKILIFYIFKSFFKKNFCFIQSVNKGILIFFWIISCFYNKNKLKFFYTLKKNFFISIGKICYPFLMISDIISIKSKFLFLGSDQIQHIEIFKKIVNKINVFCKKKIFYNYNFIVNNKILYSYDKKKMSKSNKNTLFIFSKYRNIFFFLNKFKNTLKKKKSILNFSLNIFNDNNIKSIFFKENFSNFKKKISEKIYFNFLPFKKNFFNFFEKFDKNNNIIIKNNEYYHNIINNNLKIFLKLFNL